MDIITHRANRFTQTFSGRSMGHSVSSFSLFSHTSWAHFHTTYTVIRHLKYMLLSLRHVIGLTVYIHCFQTTLLHFHTNILLLLWHSGRKLKCLIPYLNQYYMHQRRTITNLALCLDTKVRVFIMSRELSPHWQNRWVVHYF